MEQSKQLKIREAETEFKQKYDPSERLVVQRVSAVADTTEYLTKLENNPASGIETINLTLTGKRSKRTLADQLTSCVTIPPGLILSDLPELATHGAQAVSCDILKLIHRSYIPLALPSPSSKTSALAASVPDLSPEALFVPRSNELAPSSEVYMAGSHLLLRKPFIPKITCPYTSTDTVGGSSTSTSTQLDIISPAAVSTPRPSTMDSQGIHPKQLKRTRAVREKTNPITSRRRPKEAKRKLPYNQVSEEVDADVHDGPALASRKLVRISSSLDQILDNHEIAHDSETSQEQSKVCQQGDRTRKILEMQRAIQTQLLAEHRQTRDVDFPTLVDIFQTRPRESTMHDSNLPSTRSSPWHDYHVTLGDLQKISKDSSSHHGSGLRRTTLGPRSGRGRHDYRTTANDLQRHMKGSPRHSLGQSQIEHGFGTGHHVSLPDSQQTQGNNSDPNPGFTSTLGGGTSHGSMTKVKCSPNVGRQSLSPALCGSPIYCLDSHGQGTLDDPIKFNSDSETEHEDGDEDEHVDILRSCDAAPVLTVSTAPTQECAVCSGTVHKANMPSFLNCTHQPGTCAACVARWIESELTTKGWKGITCPEPSCSNILAHHEVHSYASPEVFVQYDTFATREALGQLVNFRWCRNPGCASGQEHDTDGYILTCISCGHRTCTVHDVDWHEGETCDEYTHRVNGEKAREQKAQEEASMATINKFSKKCPGPGCAFNIQKNKGCDHMTCMFRLKFMPLQQILTDFLRFTMPL